MSEDRHNPPPLPDRIERDIEPSDRTWLDHTEHTPVVVRLYDTNDVLVATKQLLIQRDTKLDTAIITDSAEPPEPAYR